MNDFHIIYYHVLKDNKKNYAFTLVLRAVSWKSAFANHPLKIMKAQSKCSLAGGCLCVLEDLGPPGCWDPPAGRGGVN